MLLLHALTYRMHGSPYLCSVSTSWLVIIILGYLRLKVRFACDFLFCLKSMWQQKSVMVADFARAVSYFLSERETTILNYSEVFLKLLYQPSLA